MDAMVSMMAAPLYFLYEMPEWMKYGLIGFISILAIIGIVCAIASIVRRRRARRQQEPIAEIAEMAEIAETEREEQEPETLEEKVSAYEVFRVLLNERTIPKIQKRFIALDIETTGLNEKSDRIVEVAAVLFEDGKAVRRFTSLVNEHVRIPVKATAINHISNAMIQSAPEAMGVYTRLIDFMGDAAKGETVVCAHNAAKFDMPFLIHALARYDIKARIAFVDTLEMAQKYLHNMDGYSQAALEEEFGFTDVEQVHRAGADAENCGKILNHILIAARMMTKEAQEERRRAEAEARQAAEAFKEKVAAYDVRSVLLNKRTIPKIWERFIALDLETTGLSETDDRIVEVAAVLFEDGKAVKRFESLVNEHMRIPVEATAINHITNAMIRSAPEAGEVFARLIDFMGDAAKGETVVCAHNGAKFDMPFLINALARYDIQANFALVDTMTAAKKYLPGMLNYKQTTLVEELDIADTEQVHRAGDDAANCGEILNHILHAATMEIWQKEREQHRLVVQMDDAGRELNIFKTANEAAQEVGGTEKIIKSALEGNRQKAAGYGWKYKYEQGYEE